MKKFTATLTAVIMLSSLLTACTDKNDSKQASSTPEASSTTPEASSTTPAAKGEVSVSVYDRGNIPAVEGKLENNRWTKYINENAPVNVNFVPIPRNDAAQKFNVLFASQSAPDIINEFDPNIVNSFIDQKLLLPLDDLIEQNSVEYKKILEDNPALKKVATSPDGKMYKIGRTLETAPSYALFIRADWLKKMKLEVPKTTEDLYKVAKAFAEQDPDGNGQKDTYGMAISWRSEFVVDMMFGNPVELYGLVDGQPSRAFDNARAATEFKKRLFDEGLIDKDFVNDKNGQKAKQDFLNGKLGIYPAFIGNWFDATVSDLETLKKAVPNAEIIPIALPESPVGQFIPDVTSPVQMTSAINASAKDPAAAIQYIDFIDRISTGTTLLFGLEGTHYNKNANGCPQIIDPDKTKAEVSWAGDYAHSYSRLLPGKCAFMQNQFNPEDPAQKAGLDIFNKAESLYLDPSKRYRFVTLQELIPTMPKELLASFNTVKLEITQTWLKSVLSGSKYSVDQAYKDVLAAWDRAGGKQMDDFMIKWYQTSQDSSFMMKDLWDMVAKQTEMKK
ncbi:sugar ABC transporter permease [Paenibacillus baekrokdamisoli]|uniref:Sugar ABC transporter permease n=1 Tax=Paenibacillus baekrokdamisoli TaxID=1712516 RepID=A0A3G9IPT7_9BACL|nr:extracellular solute-binding protein [Paenibacillus baekrokdamisoli]MBB3071977.1 putative aldouronate transport system substrate-binding protein [Paenibacillus baekrokdamisoli]BBH20282.1 sugar ABC transporter permease [Paenibacillus baekrokdamisoli]